MTIQQLKPKADPDVVDSLRRLLEQAEDGTVVGMMFVVFRPGGAVTIGRHGDVDERDVALAVLDIQTALGAARRDRLRPE